MKSNYARANSVHQLVRLSISVAIPLLIYAAVLMVGIPREISLTAREGPAVILIPIAFLVLYPAYRQTSWLGTLISFCLTLILFAIPLLGVWSSGADGQSIVDLLPWNDANMYYTDARRLLEGLPFTLGSQRRPIFAGVFAALLGLMQQNQQVTVAALNLIVAVSCFLAAREVQRSYSAAAGTLTIAVLCLFYRLQTGHVITESLGLALGAASFALLLHGARQRQINTSLLGILLLTLALNVRAGAFFILPALILWGSWSFRRTNRFSWRFLLGGFSVVLLGFVINSIVTKSICPPNVVGFGNFSYTLYGLITGGDWQQVLVDHPERAKSGGFSDSEIYGLAFEALRANPLGLVTGMFRAWKIFLFSDYPFSFVLDNTVNIGLRVLSLVALFACYLKRRDVNYSLIIAAVLAILASVPFIPPWDSAAMRVYAATIPFTSMLPGVGLAFLVEKITRQEPIEVIKKNNSPQILGIFSVVLSLLCFLGPIATKWLNKPPQSAVDVRCQAGFDSVYFHFDPGSVINLVADDSNILTHLPNIRLSDFRKGVASIEGAAQDLNGLPGSLLAKTLSDLPTNTTLINALNLKSLNQMLLIVKNSLVPNKSGLFGACGKFTTNPALQRPDFLLFYADSIKSEEKLPRVTAGATSVEPGWPASNLIDGTDAAWGSLGKDSDTIFYLTSDKAYKPKSFQITTFTGPNGTHIRDLSVVGTSDKINGSEKWHVIKSRLKANKAFSEKIIVPSLPDKSVVTIELDPNDPNLQEYKSWGLACFSNSKSYKRNYLSDSGKGGGIYVRELKISR